MQTARMTASCIHAARLVDLILLAALTARVAAAAPSITITSPADGTTTPNHTIQIAARIDDGSPGHVRVTCNGRSVSIHEGAVRCTIALHAGVNAIEVRAVDANGASVSAAFRVSQKTSGGLALVPNAVAVTINDGRPGIIAAVTSSGHAATDVGWRVADRRKLTLESDGAQASLTGTSPGRTSISARTNGRIANAKVTVVERGPFPVDFPPGTLIWAVGPIPGLRQRPPLNAVSIVHPRQSDADSVVEVEGCDLFAVDADPAGRFAVVRGLTNNGDLVWVGRIPGTPLAGDVFGGLLALVGPIGKPSRVLGRFDRADAPAGIWRFYANGIIEDVTQSGDGTIYLVENLKPDTRITVIDGRSGAVKSRLSAGIGSMLGPLVGLEDDSAVVQVRNALGLSLAHITPTGIETVAHLSAADEHQSEVEPGPAIRTRNGDTVAFWSDRAGLHLSLVRGSSVAAEFTTISRLRQRRSTWHVLIDAFESPWVYVSDGVSLVAIDLQRSEKLWQRHTSAVPFEAVDGRHVVVSDKAKHHVMELDDRGNTVLTMGATVNDARIVIQGNGILHGFDPITRSVVEISEPAYRESGSFSWLSFTTNDRLQRPF
jgi:hypothetical protein